MNGGCLSGGPWEVKSLWPLNPIFLVGLVQGREMRDGDRIQNGNRSNRGVGDEPRVKTKRVFGRQMGLTSNKNLLFQEENGDI